MIFCVYIKIAKLTHSTQHVEYSIYNSKLDSMYSEEMCIIHLITCICIHMYNIKVLPSEKGKYKQAKRTTVERFSIV